MIYCFMNMQDISQKYRIFDWFYCRLDDYRLTFCQKKYVFFLTDKRRQGVLKDALRA